MALFNMAGHLIRRLNQISTTVFYKNIKQVGYDITPVQFAVMKSLQEHAHIEQAQIAALISYDRATIGGVIDRLEIKGYISRKVSIRDRRARTCALTQQGELLLKKISPITESFQENILEGLNKEEFQIFIKLAKKVILYDQNKKLK